MDDEKIIELYWRRDETAIARTDEKYGRLCRKISDDILSSREDSEECVNDAYMRVWGSIPPNEPSSLSAYVGKITRNIALDKLRQKNSSKRGNGEVPVLLDELAECVSGADELERRQDSAEIIDALNGFLETLSATERGVFMRRYWMMEPIADVAARYDISVSKTTTMLFRLRGRLKKHFMKEGISL